MFHHEIPSLWVLTAQYTQYGSDSGYYTSVLSQASSRGQEKPVLNKNSIPSIVPIQIFSVRYVVQKYN